MFIKHIKSFPIFKTSDWGNISLMFIMQTLWKCEEEVEHIEEKVRHVDFGWVTFWLEHIEEKVRQVLFESQYLDGSSMKLQFWCWSCRHCENEAMWRRGAAQRRKVDRLFASCLAQNIYKIFTWNNISFWCWSWYGEEEQQREGR